MDNLFLFWAADELEKQRLLLINLEKADGKDSSDYTKGIKQMIELRKELIAVIIKATSKTQGEG